MDAFIKCFFCFYSGDYIVFLFSLLIWWIRLFAFWMVSWPCVLRINHLLITCIVLFIYCWIWFANILRILVPLFMRYLHVIFLFLMSFSDFSIRVRLVSEWVWKCFFFCILKSLYRICILFFFFLNVLMEFTSETVFSLWEGF